MCAELRIERRETYLHVTATGAFTPGRTQQNLSKIFDECAATGLTNVLLDARSVRLPAPIALIERYALIEMVTLIANKHRTRGYPPVRLAYVGSSAHLDRQRFGETVAANRGFDLKATTDIDEALAWLDVAPPHRGESQTSQLA
jgi:hypothetical protein